MYVHQECVLWRCWFVARRCTTTQPSPHHQADDNTSVRCCLRRGARSAVHAFATLRPPIRGGLRAQRGRSGGAAPQLAVRALPRRRQQHGDGVVHRHGGHGEPQQQVRAERAEQRLLVEGVGERAAQVRRGARRGLQQHGGAQRDGTEARDGAEQLRSWSLDWYLDDATLQALNDLIVTPEYLRGVDDVVAP